MAGALVLDWGRPDSLLSGHASTNATTVYASCWRKVAVERFLLAKKKHRKHHLLARPDCVTDRAQWRVVAIVVAVVFFLRMHCLTILPWVIDAPPW